MKFIMILFLFFIPEKSHIEYSEGNSMLSVNDGKYVTEMPRILYTIVMQKGQLLGQKIHLEMFQW